MNYLLNYYWIDSQEENVESFENKHELLSAKKVAEKMFEDELAEGKLVLACAVEMSYEEIDSLF